MAATPLVTRRSREAGDELELVDAEAAAEAGARPPTPDRWPVQVRNAVLAVAAVGLAIRLGLSLRDLHVVDRLFVPDDTYYTLSIARSIARGAGPSADGVHLTSGFQPLLAFLLLPVFALTDAPEPPLRAGLALLSLFDAATIVLLGRLAWRAAGGWAAVVGAAAWALSPFAVANALNGLETALAVACSLLVVELWCRAREAPTTWRWALVGAAAGVALLARVDTAFLVGALALLSLPVLRRASGWRHAAVAGAAALAVVLPWWGWCQATFGSPVPESGRAVQELVEIRRAWGEEPASALGWAAGTVLGQPVADLGELRDRLYGDLPAARRAWFATVGLLTLATLAWARRRGVRSGALAVSAAGLACLCFYAYEVPAIWFFPRYLAPAVVAVTLTSAALLGWLLGRRGRARPAAVLAGLVVVALLVVAGRGTLEYASGSEPDRTAGGLAGSKGYWEAAEDVLRAAPPGAVIGSTQTGALEYLDATQDLPVRVVNLDGVVDGDAARAVREGELAAFARRRGVTHLADWDVGRQVFFDRSGDPALGPDDLEVVARARWQGPDRFTLHRIRWSTS